MLARKSVHEYYDFLFVALASSHGECSKDGKCNLHSKMLNQPDDIKVIYGLEKCIQCSTVPSEYEQRFVYVFESNLSCRVHTARFSKSSDHCCFHTCTVYRRQEVSHCMTLQQIIVIRMANNSVCSANYSQMHARSEGNNARSRWYCPSRTHSN